MELTATASELDAPAQRHHLTLPPCRAPRVAGGASKAQVGQLVRGGARQVSGTPNTHLALPL